MPKKVTTWFYPTTECATKNEKFLPKLKCCLVFRQMTNDACRHWNIWMWKLTIVVGRCHKSLPQTIWIIAHFWHRHSHFGGAKFLVINNYADFSLHFLFWRLQVSGQTKVGYICLLTYHWEIKVIDRRIFEITASPENFSRPKQAFWDSWNFHGRIILRTLP